MSMLKLVCVALVLAAVDAACPGDGLCSLNGVCTSGGKCVCDNGTLLMLAAKLMLLHLC